MMSANPATQEQLDFSFGGEDLGLVGFGTAS